MKVIVVDDEPIILAMETAEVKKVLPEAEVVSFGAADEALEYARAQTVDIAFLDINLEESSGLELTRSLQRLYPRINIIFCTGYSEYALEAWEMYCSGYLMKPVTTAKLRKALDSLRYPVAAQGAGVFVRCFGNFEVYCDGAPVNFRYGKTRELFAYLVDRNGAMVSTRELMCVLFEDEDKGSYFRNLKADMLTAFQQLGQEDIFLQSWGRLGINKAKLDCDYYAYLDGQKQLFRGEYMKQYSFGEATLAQLAE